MELLDVEGVTVGEIKKEETGESCNELKPELESKGVRLCLCLKVVGDRTCKTI
jgi:hypothetical protein